MGRRFLLLVACACALAAALSSPARARTQPVPVVMSPAIIERALPGRTFSATLTLQNDGNDAQRATFAVRSLQQDLDGTPRYVPSDDLARAFTLDVSHAALAPGGRAHVHLSGAIPDGEDGSFFAVVASLRSSASPPRSSEIASQFLLRAPGTPAEHARVMEAGVFRGAHGNDTVFATLRDTSTVEIHPRVTLDIRTRAGAPLGTVNLTPADAPVILPTCDGGCARRLSAPWHAPQGEDEFSITATVTDPPAKRTLLAVVARGAPREPEASLRFVQVAPGTVVVRLTNTGTVPISGVVVVMSATEGDQPARAHATLPQPDIARHGVVDITWHPRLDRGFYTVVAAAQIGDRLLDQRVRALRVDIGGPDPASSPARAAAQALAGVLSVLSAGALAYTLLFIKPVRARRSA